MYGTLLSKHMTKGQHVTSGDENGLDTFFRKRAGSLDTLSDDGVILILIT